MPYDPYARPPGLQVPNSPMMGAQQKMQPPGAPAAPQNPYGVDPAVLEAMLGTYGDQLELGGLEEQMARAEALRGTATPEGRDSGRVYTAANPLEHLGTGIQRYRAGKRMQDLEGKQGEVRARIGENVKTYGKNYPGV